MKRVKAVRQGYYNHKRVKVGQVITLEKDSDFSEKWMVELSKESPGRASVQKTKAFPAQEEIDNSEEDVI